LPKKDRSILIASFFFPPMGLGGVQRAAKTAKYFCRSEWDVHIITSDPKSYPIRDESLTEDIANNVNVINVGDPVANNTGIPAHNGYILRNKSSFLRRIVQIPDSKKLWAKRALLAAGQAARENSIKYVLTTSPPPSVHMIGLHLKRTLNIKWMADFRDPWFADSPKPLTFVHKSLHEKLEKRIMQDADLIVGVTLGHVTDLQNRFGKYREKIHHIPNGFDDEDFEHIHESVPDKIILAHCGTLCSAHTVEPFFRALSGLEDAILKQIEFWQIGAVNENIHTMVTGRYSGKIEIKFLGYMDHVDSLHQLAKSSAIMVFGGVDKSSLNIIPAKLYEALAFKKPLMAVVEEASAVNDVITGISGVYHLNPNDKGGMRNTLRKLVDDFNSGELFNESRMPELKIYQRKYQADQMAKLLENI
jgi:glycosyltransferase involved in cell wall biosynthesis